jgi:hypothetical protein
MAPKRNMVVTRCPVTATEELELRDNGTKFLPDDAHRVQKFFRLGITNSFLGHYAAATKVAALLRGMEIELLPATFVHAFHNAKN